MRQFHPRDQNLFFKVTSPSNLAKRFLVPEKYINKILGSADNYKRWIDKKSGRPIQEPRPNLDRLHKRIAATLSRMETPDYLHSAIRGKSYLTNAKAHPANQATVKIDVKKFYVRARAQAVYHFFKDRMRCDDRAAGILARLLTVDGHLPTGSSASPIISYFAYEDLFDELNRLASSRGCIMTVYIDDVVFTGPKATRELLYLAKKILRNYHLFGHKTKSFRADQPKVVTGVALTRNGPRLPNKRQKSIADDFTLFATLPLGQGKLICARRLTGKLYEAAQVDPGWKKKAEIFGLRKNVLEGLIRR